MLVVGVVSLGPTAFCLTMVNGAKASTTTATGKFNLRTSRTRRIPSKKLGCFLVLSPRGDHSAEDSLLVRILLVILVSFGATSCLFAPQVVQSLFRRKMQGALWTASA
mmetsp:Transcript_23492/g.38275  ORF Transcript_23492/g.38275 Transcript_23492/m.38275 type:complete len:108 (-) Transcript_23492:52-375(-)